MRYRLDRPRLPIKSIIRLSRRQYAIFWARSLLVFIRVARSTVVNDSRPGGRNRSQSDVAPNKRRSRTSSNWRPSITHPLVRHLRLPSYRLTSSWLIIKTSSEKFGFDSNCGTLTSSQKRSSNRPFFGDLRRMIAPPLLAADPDGLYEYPAELLGKKITVHIDDSIIKKDKDALNKIKDNLQKAFDKINAGADKLTTEQTQSIGRMKGISVSANGPIGMVGGTFLITQRMAENPNVDKLSGDIIHDSRHAEQAKRGLSYNEETVIPMEMEASQFTVGVMNNIRGMGCQSSERL